MKQTLSASIALFLAACTAMSARDDNGNIPAGIITYSLPSTSITLEVEAIQEKFYAGPYAKFANKYLGITASEKDEVTYKLSGIKMTSHTEADNSTRYTLNTADKGAEATCLRLTNCGLISSSDGNVGMEQSWRFPLSTKGDFSEMGFTSNLTYEATTLYRTVKKESNYNKVAVQQNMVVEKSVEKRAAETADIIFSLRQKRMQIVTGDTDATYSGEAMAAAIAEISRLEKEYMTLFTGYTEYQTQTMSFDVIPEKDRENQLYIAFRISDAAGLLPADNISGKPVVMEIVPQAIEQPVLDKKDAKFNTKLPYVTYRIPAICNIKITDGVNLLLQGRLPIYQLGEEDTIPVNVHTK